MVANLKRKRATVYPLEVLKEEEAALGFSFIEAGFPRTRAEFEKNFTVKEVATKNGVHELTVTINHRRTKLALRKMVFHLAEGSLDLHGFYLRFRNGSSVTMRFNNVRKNPGVPASKFEVDLAGFDAETHRKKR